MCVRRREFSSYGDVYKRQVITQTSFETGMGYGAQFWGCTKKSNIKIIQTFQNKVPRSTVDAPWYARKDDSHRDLKIPMVTDVIKRFAAK